MRWQGVLASLLAILLLGAGEGVRLKRGPGAQGSSFPGVTGTTGNDSTIEAWKELKEFSPQRPLQKVYVSPNAGGDIDVAGSDANPGTIDEPLNGFAGIEEMINARGCGLDFILDSGDTWVLADGFENGLNYSTTFLDCPTDWQHDIGIRIRASNPDNLIDAATTGAIAWKGVHLDCDGVETGGSSDIGLGAGSTGGASDSTQAWMTLENIALTGTCQWDAVKALAGGKVATLNMLVHVDPGATNGLAHAMITQAHATLGGGAHLLSINSYIDHEPIFDTQGTPITKLNKSYMVFIGGKVYYHDMIDPLCGPVGGPADGECDGNAVYLDSCGGALFVEHEVSGDKTEGSTGGDFIARGYVPATGQDAGSHCTNQYAPSEIGMRVDFVRTLVHSLPTFDTVAGCKGGSYYFTSPKTDDSLHGYEAYGWQIRSVGGSDHVSYCTDNTGPLVSPFNVHINGYAFEGDLEGQTETTSGGMLDGTTYLGICSGGASDGNACDTSNGAGTCAGGTCSFRTNLNFTVQNGVYDDEDGGGGSGVFRLQGQGYTSWSGLCASVDLPTHWTPFFGDADSPATCPTFNDGVSRDTNGGSDGIFHDGNHDFATGTDTVTSMRCADGNVCEELVDEPPATIPIPFPAGMPPFVSNGATVKSFTIDLSTQDAGG